MGIQRLNHASFPVLSTERLVLNQVLYSDINAIKDLAGHPKIAETTLNIPSSYTIQDATNWINGIYEGYKKNTQITFAIRTKHYLTLMGAISLKINQKFNNAEIGYWVGVPYWNKGYATEVLARIIRFCFEDLLLHKIFATYLAHNEPSGKVMRKNGMVREGVLKDHIKKGEKYFDLIQYRLTKSEFQTISEME